MTTNSSDAALVAGHLAGDPSALGGIYDRYADSLHDTAAAMLNDRNEAADVLHDVILIAAERLGQLRDPDRLKPWLFAILRNEVYRRSKKRRRTIVTDFSGSDDGYDLVDDRTIEVGEGVADDAAGDDLAELVRGAARWLGRARSTGARAVGSPGPGWAGSGRRARGQRKSELHARPPNA